MKPRAVTFFCLFFLLPFLLFSQQEEWYIGKPIKDFTFSGLATVSENDLRPIVKPYIGKTFTMDLFWEVQGKLFAMDDFENIEGEAKQADDARSSVIVNFSVRERPAVSSIVLVGNHDLRNSDILDKVLLKKGDLVSQAKVKSDETALRGLYLEKGYTDVSISGKFDANQTDNTAVVTFTISEGSQTTIKEIHFSGNTFASESTLSNLMKTKPPFLFDTGVFQESKLEEDKKAIIDYYTDHGYVDAKIERINREVLSEAGKNSLVLTIYIAEGLQWNYGGLDLAGNSVFPTSRLQELAYQKPGKVLSLQKLQADYQRIVTLYQDNGYIYNAFSLKENRNEQAKTIQYTIQILERDKAHIENLIFKGNKVTKDFVLRRELPFEEGDIFDRAKIIDGVRNLYNLGYFSSVDPEPADGSAEGLMNIVFNVEEQSTADITFGMQLSGQQFPITGTIKWGDKNFMGLGQTLGVDLEASPSSQSLSFNFIEPWMFAVRWSGGVTLSFNHSTLQNVYQDILPPFFSDAQFSIAAPDPFTNQTDYLAMVQQGHTVPQQYLMSYDSFDIGIGFTSGYMYHFPPGWLGVNGGISSRFRYLTYDSSLYRPYDPSIRNNWKTWNIINRITTTVYLDGRDNFFNPTTGYKVSQGLGYTGGILFGSRDYIRTDSVLEGFLTLLDLPVAEDWNLLLILAAHSGVSLILPQFGYTPPGGSTPIWDWTAPIVDPSDLLYIDGMTVARGWGQVYGEALWDNKIELRVPVTKETLWGIAFFDMAGIWQSPTDMFALSANDLLFSFGFGVRFAFPQFPIRLYLGKRFQVQNGQLVWKNGTLGDPNGFNFDFIISLGGDVF
jgi:outer membrane protein insertion porin family